MSTRCKIIIQDGLGKRVQVHRHADGVALDRIGYRSRLHRGDWDIGDHFYLEVM